MQVLKNYLIVQFKLKFMMLKFIIMKNFFIFLSILTVFTVAFIDIKDRFAELDNVASSPTPSQIEMKRPLNRKDIESSNVQYKDNKNDIHENMRNKVKHNLQNSINEMNKKKNPLPMH